MNLSRCTSWLLVAVLPCVPSVAGEGDAAKTATSEQIAALIAQLGSDEFAVREQAQRRLGDLEEALPALRAAAKSEDPEVRRAAQELVGRLEARLEERFVREALARVNDEGLDVFIDRMVLEKDYPTEARWKAAVEVARALAKHAARHGATVPNIFEPGSIPSIRMLVDGFNDQRNTMHERLLFSSGTVESINSTDRSILFVNGDIKSLNSTTNSIIFCNGTIKSFNYTKGCIIFCNGVVESMNCTDGNAVFVRGELRRLNYTKGNVIEATTLGRGNLSEGNTYLNRKAQEVPGGKDDRFVAAEPSLLELFRYFEPARAGLKFTMVEGDARVDEVTEGKAFARAGLRNGDRVLAIDHEKFLAVDSFIRLLRRNMVAGKLLLKVQRGDRVLEIPVSFLP
jgi:hypothetical protein